MAAKSAGATRGAAAPGSAVNDSASSTSRQYRTPRTPARYIRGFMFHSFSDDEQRRSNQRHTLRSPQQVPIMQEPNKSYCCERDQRVVQLAFRAPALALALLS